MRFSAQLVELFLPARRRPFHPEILTPSNDTCTFSDNLSLLFPMPGPMDLSESYKLPPVTISSSTVTPPPAPSRTRCREPLTAHHSPAIDRSPPLNHDSQRYHHYRYRLAYPTNPRVHRKSERESADVEETKKGISQIPHLRGEPIRISIYFRAMLFGRRTTGLGRFPSRFFFVCRGTGWLLHLSSFRVQVGVFAVSWRSVTGPTHPHTGALGGLGQSGAVLGFGRREGRPTCIPIQAEETGWI